MDLTAYLRDIPDFPKPGILFKDISPLLADPAAFSQCIDQLAEHCTAYGPTAIVGIESRGFIFGAALAKTLGCGFVPIRKPGKLPAETISRDYQLEYGTDSLEMHKDAFKPGSQVIVLDDVLATGGTLEAAIGLCADGCAEVLAALCVIELDFLNGAKRLAPLNVPVVSLLHF